jgi:hypothetical protein
MFNLKNSLKRAQRLIFHICPLWLGASFTVIAQSSQREIVNQPIEWFALVSNIKVHKNITLLAEGQFRYVQSFDPMQFQARTGIDIHLSKHLSVLPGYVYTLNPVYGKQPAAYVNNEHRIYGQVNYKHSIGKLALSHRVRLEKRYIQVHTKDQNGDIIDNGYSLHVNRGRYRFNAVLPLSEKLNPKTFYLNVYDEVFISWGGPITYHEPDQNRIFVGGGYQFTKLISFQAGALYQMLVKANGTKQENNVGFQAQLTYNFDFTKKEN